MDPNRWRQIEALYHDALAQPAAERAGFVRRACDDTGMVLEVESLLAFDGSARGPIDSPAWDGARTLLEHPAEAELSAGDQVGPYRITRTLGAGSMGRVYEAHDSRLGRSVAIKVARARFSERFEREARAIAALNHPNICTLYDVGPNYLVMELVEGPTLAARIKRGKIPLDEALQMAGQIADALDAAHEKGIVHRDLKPANIKVKPDGTVKVLDFGVAKLTQASAPEGESGTESGMVIGTAAYMSPEQARGEVVDRRADVWAFGAVLFEMLSGKRPIQGEGPDYSQVAEKARKLIQACLVKDAKNRLRNVGDGLRLLVNEEQPGVPALTRSRWLWPGIAAALVILTATVSFLYWRTKPAAVSHSVSFQIVPEGIVRYHNLALSPDGRKLAFTGEGLDGAQRLWIRDFDSLAIRSLPEGEGAFGPVWSPDSKHLAFAAHGKVRKIDLAGGPSQVLCNWPGDSVDMTGVWGTDGVILFSRPGDGLQRVSASGGVCTDVATRGRLPYRLPDGRHFLTYLSAQGKNPAGLYAGVLDKDAAQALQLIFPYPTPVLSSSSSNGKRTWLVYLRDGALVVQPFDTARLKVAGDPVLIAGGAVSIYSGFSFSASGAFAWTSNSTGRYQVRWYDRKGKVLGNATDPGDWGDVNLSPDDKVAAIHDRGGADDLWLFDFARGMSSRFTFSANRDHQAVWSPDGSRIVWGSQEKEGQSLIEKAANGAGPEQVLVAEGGVAYDWSPDGRFLLFVGGPGLMPRDDVGGLARVIRPELMTLPLKSDGSPAGPAEPYLKGQTPFAAYHARFSPNGRWITYTIATGPSVPAQDVFVSPFPAPPGGGNRWAVSSGGGFQPMWRHDGKELLYFSRDSKLMSVDVDTNSATFKMGTPKPLFEAPVAGGPPAGPTHRWDLTRDGQRFLINTALDTASSPLIQVVTDWEAGLN